MLYRILTTKHVFSTLADKGCDILTSVSVEQVFLTIEILIGAGEEGSCIRCRKAPRTSSCSKCWVFCVHLQLLSSPSFRITYRSPNPGICHEALVCWALQYPNRMSRILNPQPRNQSHHGFGVHSRIPGSGLCSDTCTTTAKAQTTATTTTTTNYIMDSELHTGNNTSLERTSLLNLTILNEPVIPATSH